jgi:hypothetical protein
MTVRLYEKASAPTVRVDAVWPARVAPAMA